MACGETNTLIDSNGNAIEIDFDHDFAPMDSSDKNATNILSQLFQRVGY